MYENEDDDNYRDTPQYSKVTNNIFEPGASSKYFTEKSARKRWVGLDVCKMLKSGRFV